MKTEKKRHITKTLPAALAGTVFLMIAALTAYADENEQWNKSISGLTDSSFQAGSTLSFVCSDEGNGILAAVDSLSEAFLDTGELPAVRVLCPELSYEKTLTADSKHLIQWTAPWNVKNGCTIQFHFSFGDQTVASPFFSCVNTAKDLGAKTIDLLSGSAPVSSEKTLDDICSTLSSLTEDGTLSLMWGDLCYADLDNNGEDDLSLGKNEIKKLETCSISGDFTLKVTSAAKAYLIQEGLDYYGSLTFRFPKAAASSASAAPAAASSASAAPAASSASATPAAASSSTAAPTKAKAVNPMKVKGKTVKIKYKTLNKKKKLTIKRKKAITVSKAKGTVTYKLVSVKNKKFKKYFKINAKTGKITVKKGVKKGTYKLKIRVKAAGNANYKAKAKNVTVKIKVS